jgi:SNF2 family DNA or RNA helicase
MMTPEENVKRVLQKKFYLLILSEPTRKGLTMDMTRYKFKTTPYQHQLDALKKAWDKEEFALFAEMGTGKSKILIDNVAMLYDSGKIDGVLVIAPKGVYKNWERTEFPKHLPDHVLFDSITWSPSQTKKQEAILAKAFVDDDNLKIVIMNIEAFSTVRGTQFAIDFMRRKRVLMAVDESTTIKNGKAKRTKNTIKAGILARYRRLMTGSPITKSPMDLYSQCGFLGDHLLGFSSFYSFQNRYCRLLKRNVGTHSFQQVVGYQNLSELTDRLDKFSYRILKKDCLDLPDKVYTKRSVELTDEQAILYQRIKRSAVAELEGKTLTAQNVLTQILRLQQICSGYFKADDGTIIEMHSNKFSELTDVLEEVSGKVIIWANYTYDLTMIHKKLCEVYGPESSRMYYGGTEADDRQQMVIDFQDPNHPLRFFVGQPRTGGYGLTLTEASTVIYFSNNYDLEIRLQSEDRAHRIGQKNNVTYIDIVTEGTVDEKILQALRSKINIATEVLREGYKDWLI